MCVIRNVFTSKQRGAHISDMLRLHHRKTEWTREREREAEEIWRGGFQNKISVTSCRDLLSDKNHQLLDYTPAAASTRSILIYTPSRHFDSFSADLQSHTASLSQSKEAVTHTCQSPIFPIIDILCLLPPSLDLLFYALRIITEVDPAPCLSHRASGGEVKLDVFFLPGPDRLTWP